MIFSKSLEPLETERSFILHCRFCDVSPPPHGPSYRWCFPQTDTDPPSLEWSTSLAPRSRRPHPVPPSQTEDAPLSPYNPPRLFLQSSFPSVESTPLPENATVFCLYSLLFPSAPRPHRQDIFFPPLRPGSGPDSKSVG